MKRVKIKFSSVTHTMNAKQIIEENGGRVKVGKNTTPGKNEGCGYYLIVYGNIEKYLKLLKINNVKFIGFDYI